MLDLVFKHQQPRIDLYVRRLREAYKATSKPLKNTDKDKSTLFKEALENARPITTYKWIDDHGLGYDISFSGSVDHGVSTISIDQLEMQNLDPVAEQLFRDIQQLCTNSSSAQEDDVLTKHISSRMFDDWKDVKRQSKLKSWIHQFVGKRHKQARTALLYLRRVYCSVVTFIEVAQRLPIIKTVECVAVPFHLTRSDERLHLTADPLTLASELGVEIVNDFWKEYLGHPNNRIGLQKRLSEHRSQHAEIQVLNYHDEYLTKISDAYLTHPYIGCSKLCCLLCYLFIGFHKGFATRGTHLTVMNTWALPKQVPSASSQTRLETVARSLFECITEILDNLFCLPQCPPKIDAMVQSSLALPTTKTTAEEELTSMEENVMHKMPVSMMLGGEIMIVSIPKKPGYVTVYGGDFPKLKVMLSSEAERYKDDKLRSLSGLEILSDQDMFPTPHMDRKTCRRCRQPAFHRCCRCRVRYCGNICQVKD